MKIYFIIIILGNLCDCIGYVVSSTQNGYYMGNWGAVLNIYRTIVRTQRSPNTLTSTARNFLRVDIFSPNPPIPPYVYRNVYRKIPINTTLSSSSFPSNHPIFTLSHPHIPHKSSRTNGFTDTHLPDSHPNRHFPCIINVFHLIHPTLRYTLFYPFDSQLHSS